MGFFHDVGTWVGDRTGVRADSGSGNNVLKNTFGAMSGNLFGGVLGAGFGGKVYDTLFNPPKAPAPLQAPAAPNAAANSLLGTQNQVKDLRRRFNSRTLFTGGQGALDQPSTASSVLLGA